MRRDLTMLTVRVHVEAKTDQKSDQAKKGVTFKQSPAVAGFYLYELRGRQGRAIDTKNAYTTHHLARFLVRFETNHR